MAVQVIQAQVIYQEPQVLTQYLEASQALVVEVVAHNHRQQEVVVLVAEVLVTEQQPQVLVHQAKVIQVVLVYLLAATHILAVAVVVLEQQAQQLLQAKTVLVE